MQRAKLKDNHTLLSYVILLFLSAVWGSSFIIMKKVNPVFDPIQISSLRLIFAGAVALPLVNKQFKTFSKRHWTALLLVGIIGNAIPSFLFAVASEEINSATSGILNGLAPIFTLILGVFFFSFKGKTMHYIGAAMGLLGCLFVIQGNDAHGEINNMWYAIFPFVGSLCYGFSSNIIKSRLTDLKPIISGSTPFIFGAILGLIAMPFSLHHHTPEINTQFYEALGLMVILGVFGSTLSMVLFNRLVQLNSALFASTVTFIMPLFAILWGLWDGENIRGLQILGLVLILSAVYAVRRGDRKKKVKQ